MGIANPRPAMRGREDRIIRLKLTFHALRTGELVARGEKPLLASFHAQQEAKRTNFASLDRKLQAQKKERIGRWANAHAVRAEHDEEVTRIETAAFVAAKGGV